MRHEFKMDVYGNVPWRWQIKTSRMKVLLKLLTICCRTSHEYGKKWINMDQKELKGIIINQIGMGKKCSIIDYHKLTQIFMDEEKIALSWSITNRHGY